MCKTIVEGLSSGKKFHYLPGNIGGCIMKKVTNGEIGGGGF